jgi:hypothetical protein
MGWAGSGALIAWHDVEEGREAEYLDWHAHEHMKERLAIPGFLQGRRYSVVGSGPQFLILYTVADPNVFTSQTYLEHLNHPTDWTQRVMPALRNMNRSLCRVAASSGFGAGCWLQTTRFSPEHGRDAHLRGILMCEAQSLSHQRGVCGARLLIADQDRNKAQTRETALRAGPDTVADWVLLVEGYDETAVAEDRSRLLRQSGAGPDITADLYRIDHICF